MSEPLELTEGQRVTVGGREFVVEWSGCAGATPELAPAPKPLLPWEEHPDAWWHSESFSTDGIFRSPALVGNVDNTAGWTRVLGAVPADTHIAFERDLAESVMDTLNAEGYAPLAAAVESALS